MKIYVKINNNKISVSNKPIKNYNWFGNIQNVINTLVYNGYSITEVIILVYNVVNLAEIKPNNKYICTMEF